MINLQFGTKETAVLLRELEAVLKNYVPGDIVELGCYAGDTSLLIQQSILRNKSSKSLYIYDSFMGLPGKSEMDLSPAGMQFKEGELRVSKKLVIKKFKQYGIDPPVIKKAWFNELKNEDLPDKIALAFLDGDFYDSIKDSLELIWPKLSKGSVVVIDDYQNEALPGVQKAVDYWLARKKATMKIESSLAIVKNAGIQ